MAKKRMPPRWWRSMVAMFIRPPRFPPEIKRSKPRKSRALKP
jgi:hypothetical protein